MLAVLIGAAAGYAIVALRLRHGFVWFVFIFGGTIFPLQMVLMPLFSGYASSGLYDTRAGMILIYTAISVPFSAFVMRNFFTGIARSVFEAAIVDGGGLFRIFRSIYLPMAASALAAIFILQATFVWNDLLLGPDAEPVRLGPSDHAGADRTAEHVRRCRAADRPGRRPAGVAADRHPVPGRPAVLLPGPRPRPVLKAERVSMSSIVVTGGAAGIGRGAVERFVAAGDRVFVLDRTPTLSLSLTDRGDR